VSTTTRKIDAARRAVDQASPEGRERRFVAAEQIETRSADDGTWSFEGYAAVFDSRSEDLGYSFSGSTFTEIVKRGAFEDVLKDPATDVVQMHNHDVNQTMARTSSGTLDLSEQPKGLRAYIAEMPDVTYARDLRVLLDRRDISKMSFGFQMGEGAEQEYHEDTDGNVTRTIYKVGGLFDVCTVTFPAYTGTDAQARSLCGISIFDGDKLDVERLRSLAWKIHRGETNASADERRAIDTLLESRSTVSPWTAERTLVAVASEPELLAAVAGKRARVELTESAAPAFRQAAAARRLRARAHLVGPTASR
jgi:HK97 family phage prohead protease